MKNNKNTWNALFDLVDEIAATKSQEEIDETWEIIKSKNLGGPTVDDFKPFLNEETGEIVMVWVHNY